VTNWDYHSWLEGASEVKLLGSMRFSVDKVTGCQEYIAWTVFRYQCWGLMGVVVDTDTGHRAYLGSSIFRCQCLGLMSALSIQIQGIVSFVLFGMAGLSLSVPHSFWSNEGM
jgi:hypothetical protein